MAAAPLTAPVAPLAATPLAVGPTPSDPTPLISAQSLICAPDPEVVSKATRRHYSLPYKRAIIAEVEACQSSGDIGAILRREGLYYSALRNFRQQLARVDTANNSARQLGVTATRPGRNGRSPQDLAAQVAKLEREKKRLERKLQQAQTVIAVQKKLSEMLGMVMEATPLDLDGEDL